MFKLLDKLEKQHFYEMFELEKRFYPEEFITPVEASFEYYTRYAYSTVAAAQNGRIAGFINLFPVKEEVFSAILAGSYNDSGLTSSDIADISECGSAKLNMFLSCIAVEECTCRHALTGALLRAAIENYAHIAPRFELIATDSITDAGRRFSLRMGLTPIAYSDHATTVFTGSYSEFCSRAKAYGLAR